MPGPLILLSNDDGYQSTGLAGLRAALAKVATVVVCAPAAEQSATSHAISLNRALRLKQQSEGVFSLDGTPADCVYVALNAEHRVLPRAPDLVVSGMNHGLNLGTDVFYSGTVAAAREAVLQGVSGLAVSMTKDTDLGAAAVLAARIAEEMMNRHSAHPILLNANFPAGAAWPVEATRLGTRSYTRGVHFRHDPAGEEYLWIRGAEVTHDTLTGSDTGAFDRGVVGITPLSTEMWRAEGAGAAGAVAEATRR